MKGKIYKITNLINSKVYIGQTILTLQERFARHCLKASNNDKYHKNMVIKKAILKYGKLNFTIELIEEVDVSKLNEREIYWISVYDSYNKGYNCTLGGLNGATRKYKLTLKEENEVIEAKYLGYTSKEISEVYGIDKTSVANIFKRHKLNLPQKRLLSSRIDKVLFRKYAENNRHTIELISNKFKICKCSVYNLIKKYKIEYKFSKSVQTLASKVEG